ncbi:GGDEF domain-containing protein [Micromonospora sp. RTGN7]|uniref:GGDEF domain-containing protein n=1 Tax=Micromonospora sp. RTGN7 TaxID=3016526 RepID=UPI0029FF02F7|nr:GGDEF domain-containing protein [Micromonospora sp. RTGN7]
MTAIVPDVTDVRPHPPRPLGPTPSTGSGSHPTGRIAYLEARVAFLQAQLVEARREACTDPLTGLYNRAGLAGAWWAVQGDYQLGLLDLDRFKAINDTYGHPAGDAVLTAIAGELLGWPIAARLGGDELVIVGRMQGTPDRAWRVALPDGPTVTVTATVGLAPVVLGDLHATLRRADAAMYRAKRAAPGSVAAYDPALDDRPMRSRPRLRLRDRIGGTR